MEINAAMFGMYDIRGIYGEDLNTQVAERLGKTFGTIFLGEKAKQVVVGRDNRVSGPELQKIFVEGLLSTGINVLDLGTIVTPMTYFTWKELQAKATVMITASHNPPEYNGFKVTLHQKAMFGEAYQEVLAIAQRGEFATGQGQLEKFDLWPKYRDFIVNDIKLAKPLKVVVDCGNGTTSLFAVELLEKIGCETTGLYTKSDGSFPNHPPYPQKTEYYGELVKTIKEKGADVGLAFDGDGDRLGIYTEKGEYIAGDLLTVVFAREILKTNPGAKMVMNISTSLAMMEDVRERGGEVILAKTGYPFITSKMKEIGAVFGGEISGHFFFADRYYGFDDAFYATARFLEILAQSGKTVSDLFADMPQFYTTPEFRVKAPEEPAEAKFKIIEKIVAEVKAAHPQAEVLDFDGIRFSFPDGWGLIRASNTQPMLTGRAEAKSKERLEEIKKIIQDRLAAHQVTLNWDDPVAK